MRLPSLFAIALSLVLIGGIGGCLDEVVPEHNPPAADGSATMTRRRDPGRRRARRFRRGVHYQRRLPEQHLPADQRRRLDGLHPDVRQPGPERSHLPGRRHVQHARLLQDLTLGQGVMRASAALAALAPAATYSVRSPR